MLFNEGRGAARRPSRSSRLRFLRTSLGNGSEGIFLGCRRRALQRPGKVEAASAARLRRGAYGGTLPGVCGTPCSLHRPATSLPPFYYKLIGIG